MHNDILLLVCSAAVTLLDFYKMRKVQHTTYIQLNGNTLHLQSYTSLVKSTADTYLDFCKNTLPSKFVSSAKKAVELLTFLFLYIISGCEKIRSVGSQS